MPPSVRFAVHTDVGRVRQRNEDSWATVPEIGLAVVADGMGGHPGGDVASREATDAVVAELSRLRAGRGDDPLDGNLHESLGEAMARCVLTGHEAVRLRGTREPGLRGMGTTLTALTVHAESGRWAVGHAGDSRAYLLRDGSLRQITRDDTWVQAQIEAGRISPEEARHHPAAHVLTQCLGLESPPEPRSTVGEVEESDRFLLCTDGLSGMVPDDEIQEALEAHADPEEAARDLVERALARGGTDNVTVVVVDAGGS